MKQLFTILSISIVCLCCLQSKAQLVLKDSFVTVPAGAQYKASGWKELWWGKHYRPEWIAPVKFQVIDLDKTAGGLTPLKRGGGHETKSLRLLGADGKEYVLRTMDKTLDLLVPEDFKGTFVNDIINDQISTAHPYGPIAVARLADAANLYHTNPSVVFVTHNSRLKEFESTFANELCLFEERPSGDGWEKTPLTGNADEVVNTESLLEDVQKDNDNSVDQKSFLRVRMFDVWINDWDRHEDQWVWLGNKKNGKTVYSAFGRDRDQSFSKTDGINLYFLSRPWVLPSLQNMDDKVKNIIGTTLSARFLDKQFLNELTRDDWKNVIESLQSSLTDQKIRDAMAVLPDTVFKLSGEELIQKLIARRNDMMRYGMEYYDILSRQVDIIGSDKKEAFTVKEDADKTEVTVEKINKSGQKDDIIFHRVFLTSETKFIYLYGLDGDDVFTVDGNTNAIKVNIIGGDGKDDFATTGNKSYNGKIGVYDYTTNRVSATGPFKTHFTNDSTLNKYNRRSFKYDWYAPFFLPGYNADDGVFLGAGFTYKKQRWGKQPYAWQQTIGASAALKTGAVNFYYTGKFSQVFGKWNLGLYAAYNGPEYVFNFYGYGNNTVLLTDDKAFYRVRAEQLIFNPEIFRTFGNQEFKIGPVIEDVEVDGTQDRFIKQPFAGVDSIIFDHNTFVGADVKYSIGKTDNDRNPSKGYRFQIGATYKKNITTGEKDFANINSSFSFYVPLGKLVFAHRTGAATNFGDFEFYHANTLGGNDNLRGYYRSRFTGKSAFYQNTELRYPFANLRGYVLRGKLGIYGFFDDGRVWIDDEHSDKIHTGYGGGLFFLPYNAACINIAYGTSSEKSLLRVSLGFFF